MKFKIITRGGRIFLIRISIPTTRGSIKVHLILSDDKENPHMHPWNYVSFLLLGAYKEIVDGKLKKHLPFTVVRRRANERHQVILYRLFGVGLPCLSIGVYSRKLQRWCERETLCDHCQGVGRCLDKVYWDTISKR